MLADLEPVNRESTAAIIARQLRDAIMTGALPPGTQLQEADLAAQFQVSRGPLREAMQRLVAEGLLHSERHRGLFVIELEPGDISDIYQARLAIEWAAAIQVVRSGDREQVAELLTEAMQDMAKADEHDDPRTLAEADLAFHEALIQAGGSRRLMRMAQTLLIETRMCLSNLPNLSSLHRSRRQEVDERIAEHKRIIEALRNGDEELLLHLLEVQTENAVQRLTPDARLFS